MLFKKIAEYFDLIESVSSRLEMIDILSNLFNKANNNEIKKIIYLCQSELGPKFDQIDFGIGEKFVEDAISKSSGFTKQEIEKRYKETGDLGLVAVELTKHKKQLSLVTQELSLEKVFENFLKIAKTQGTGSQELKIKLLAELLNYATPIEAKYLIRIPLKNLRLGSGDPTIMDSLAILFIKEKRKDKKLVEEIKKNIKGKKDNFENELNKKIRMWIRERIEEKYNIYSDLGFIAEILKTKGLNGLTEVKITPGVPIRPSLAERLKSGKEIIKKIGKCAIEAKYDGFRLQIHKNKDKVTIFSRGSEEMTPMFPDLVKAINNQIKAERAIIEGEALAINEQTNEFYPFQVTITRKRKYDIKKASEDLPLKLFLFDIMYADGKNLMELTFEERRRFLRKLIREGNTIELTKSIITDKPEEVEKFFEESIEQGLEGIIAKDLTAKYVAGARKFSWIKLKRSYKGSLEDTIDVAIIGYFKGRGKRTQFGLGALLTAVYDEVEGNFKSIAKVGTGMNEEQLAKLEEILSKIAVKKKPLRVKSELTPDVWVNPEYVIEVRADEITKSPTHMCGRKNNEGYALRFPRMIKIREKPVEQATSESEIIKMYKAQRHLGVE